jgi:DNA-directed RNA polymerase specialized sigma24 family protein
MGESEVQDDGGRSDERLWEAFVGGDDEALVVLERRYRAELFWYLLLSMGKQDAAARALRSTWALLAAFRAPHDGFGSFRAWLYAVATQNAVPATHPDAFGLGDLIDDLKRAPQTTERGRLFFYVTDMARALRQPFLLVTLAGLSVEEAAGACNFTVERTWGCLGKAYGEMARAVRKEAASAR